MREESEQILIEKFNEIRADHEKYGREQIIDAWQMQSLFRNKEIEKRIDELEEKLFLQSAANYAFMFIIGLLLGTFLFHVFG